MPTTLRVAELETLFSANDQGLVAVLDQAEKRTAEFDGTRADATLGADATDALRRIDDVQTGLRQVDSTTAEAGVSADTRGATESLEDFRKRVAAANQARAVAKLEADGLQALQTLADLQAELDDVNRTRTEVEIEADAAKAIAEADRIAAQLKKLNDERAIPEIDVDADGAERGLRRAEDALGEFKDEASSTAKEGAASFTGEFDDVADIVQETLANAFVGFGPAATAAGLVAAAGLGFVISKAQETADAVNAAGEEVGALSEEIVNAKGVMADVDMGARFREWGNEIIDVRSAWEFWQESAVTNLDKVRDALARAGEDQTAFMTAMASGDVEEAARLLNGYQQRISDLDREMDPLIDAQTRYAGEMGNAGLVTVQWGEAQQRRLDALQDERDALSDLVDPLQTTVDQMRDAQERADLYAAASEGVTVEQYKMKRALDEVNQVLQDAGASTRDAEQANLDLAEQIEETNRVLTERDEKTGQLISTENERKQALLDLADQIVTTAAAEEQAKGTTEAWNDTIAAQRQQFLDAAAQMGITGQEAEDLADSYGLIPKNVHTDITADGTPARLEGETTAAYLNRLHAAIDVAADTSDAYDDVQALYDYVQGLNATLRVQGNYGAERHVSTGRGGAGGQTMADGGVRRTRADGAIDRLPDVATIMPPTPHLVQWAEPETEGEAFIPYARSKRARSMAILTQVARDFGVDIVNRADGSIDVPTAGTALAAPGLPPIYLNFHGTSREDAPYVASEVTFALRGLLRGGRRDYRRGY